ncbi:hypothetical protein B5F35_17865 [Anaeromassilibacillus sp. An200]|nr:hypothetical protein B5F35_17865 [Anaeromassilibacillus sp. An200]
MPFYDSEAIERARQVDLLTYLQTCEPQELVHVSGNVYCTRTHDSLRISNGKWCWFSRGTGGYSALDYLIKVNGYSFLEAIVTANDEVYQNISSSLSDTTALVTTLIIVITAVSMVLIILILSMSIRSRKRETGILLAVGIAKPAVILQYVLETLLIAVVAFPLAYLSSKQVAGALGTLFGKAAENVIVTPEHFILVAIVGGVLLVAAVLVSSISTMRLKPKQILSQME